MLDVPEGPISRPAFKEQVVNQLRRFGNLIHPHKNQAATPLLDDNTKTNLQDLDIPDQEEKIANPTGLGKTFQDSLSTLTDSELPPVMEGGGVLAIIGTNEMLTDETVLQVRNSVQVPDGYIFGAGFGNIISNTLFYPEGKTPQALCAVDVMPNVVVARRMLSQIMAHSKSFPDFQRAIANKELLTAQFESVVAGETNPAIQERFRTVSLAEIEGEFKRIQSQSLAGLMILKDSLVPHAYKRVDVLALIEKQYEILHQMAVNDNIGIALADMTSPAVLERVKSLPGFTERRNIVYMSNVIDHLTNRGTNLEKLNSFSVLKTLGEGDNWFVDTTQQSLDYNLRASHQVPEYQDSDFRI